MISNQDLQNPFHLTFMKMFKPSLKLLVNGGTLTILIMAKTNFMNKNT